jgi:hypothetical protein
MESGQLVLDATKRRLATGWESLAANHLTEVEKAQIQKLADTGRYYYIRGYLGTALHRAVEADLAQTQPPGRFVYNSNGG